MVRPSPLACTECRQHHVKCDAKTPSCSRCSDVGLMCKYLPSRRGRNRRARDGHRQEYGAASDLLPRSDGSEDNTINLPLPSMSSTGEGHGSSTSEERAHRLASPVNQDVTSSDTRLARLFYENFHSAHPILVPAFEYEKRRYPSFLQQVVQFIGSHYSLQVSSDSLRQSTAVHLSSSGARTPSVVKALLLYSTILCARGEISEAQTAFSRSLDIALELGMYRKEFATLYSEGQELEAESLRRTWWELTIIEVYMAALQKRVALRCGSAPYDVGLPCEEYVYANNHTIPPSPTFASFSGRVLTDDEENLQSRYSSFSYRIDAVCILARVLVLNSLAETHRDRIQAVENAVVSWTNHLPPNKVDIVNTYGVVDEMLFQAHTTIQYAAMLLHLPRGNIRSVVPNSGTIICPTTASRLSPSLTHHVHDIKATEASKELSNLLSMHPSAQRYSPFIICGLALCGMVQIATNRIHSPDCTEHHRNRVVLVLGCLKVLRRNWPIAHQAYHYVRQAAAEAFTAWTGHRCFQSQSQSKSNPPAALKDSPASSHSSTGGTEVLHTTDNTTATPSNAVGSEIFSPGLLSAYIDPTCSDPSLLNNIFDLDLT